MGGCLRCHRNPELDWYSLRLIKETIIAQALRKSPSGPLTPGSFQRTKHSPSLNLDQDWLLQVSPRVVDSLLATGSGSLLEQGVLPPERSPWPVTPETHFLEPRRKDSVACRLLRLCEAPPGP